MSKPIKIVVKKTPGSRSSRRSLPQKLKPLSTFRPASGRWMLTVLRTINPPSKQTNTSKKRLLNKIFPSLKNLDSSLFNASKTPKSLTDLKKIIGIISAIKQVVVIVAFIIQGLKALFQPLGLI